MIKSLMLVVLLSLAAVPVTAQSIVYGGGSVAMDAGSRGGFDTLGTFPAAGGFIGWRFHDAWSIEVHVDKAFAESAEREQLEIFGRSIVQDRAAYGHSVLGVWKLRRQSRVGAAVTMGVSVRRLRTERLSFTKIIPDDPYPVSVGTASTDAGAGWTGGVLVPIALGRGVSLAPEVRVTFGLTRESVYAQFYPGVRLMWGF